MRNVVLALLAAGGLAMAGARRGRWHPLPVLHAGRRCSRPQRLLLYELSAVPGHRFGAVSLLRRESLLQLWWQLRSARLSPSPRKVRLSVPPLKRADRSGIPGARSINART